MMIRLFPGPKSPPLSDRELWDEYDWPVPTGRPWVRANMVVTVDGAAVDHNQRSTDISSDADRTVFRLLRAGCDALVVGSGTASSEDYTRIPVDPRFAPLRRESRMRPEPELVIVSRRSDVATHHDEDGRPLDPAQLIPALFRAGRQRILCEGGPELLAQLLSAGLIDELCVTVTPHLFGPTATGPMNGLPPGSRMLAGHPWGSEGVDLELASLVEHQGTLLLRWRPQRRS